MIRLGGIELVGLLDTVAVHISLIERSLPLILRGQSRWSKTISEALLDAALSHHGHRGRTLGHYRG